MAYVVLYILVSDANSPSISKVVEANCLYVGQDESNRRHLDIYARQNLACYHYEDVLGLKGIDAILA